MPRPPEIAVLISTFERPDHLRRALLSVAMQRGVDGRMELVVTDDGSQDETLDIVREFAQSVDFRVHLTTHPHDGFQLARCRNEGVRASTAPYLLFLDGDCVLPPDHIHLHLQRRKSGVTVAGDCCRLDEATSQRVDEASIRNGTFVAWAPRSERQRMARQHRKAWFYNLVRHRTKPKLIGNNIGIWRSDYEGVNGYDENFVGWGCEDDDLRLRLKRAGVRIESILNQTCTYHLWHPYVPSAPGEWRRGANVGYLRRPLRMTRCRRGLMELPPSDLRVRFVGRSSLPASVTNAVPAGLRPSLACDRAEVEILVLPGSGRFTGQADCNLLVVLEGSEVQPRAARAAHVIVSNHAIPGAEHQPRFSLEQFDQALRSVA